MLSRCVPLWIHWKRSIDGLITVADRNATIVLPAQSSGDGTEEESGLCKSHENPLLLIKEFSIL